MNLCQVTNKDLVTCNTDFSLSLIDADTFEFKGKFIGHKDKVNEARFTNINDPELLNAIFSASEDGSVAIWDKRSEGAPVQVL